MSYQLNASLGLAFVQVLRKEYDAADLTLAGIADQARSAGDEAALGKALMARATVAGEQGRSYDLIRFSHDALPHVPDEYTAFGLFLNLAIEYRKVGDATRSRRIALYVANQAPDHEQHLAALFLLLSLAIDARRETEYRRTKRALDRCTLPEALHAEAQAIAERARAVFNHEAQADPFVPAPLRAADAIDAQRIGVKIDAMMLAALNERAS